MKRLASALRLLSICWKPLLLFELIFKLSTAALFAPLFKLSFANVMRLTGRRYLTAENIVGFFAHPFTLCALAIFVLLISAYALFDIAAVSYWMDQAYQGRCASIPNAIRFALKTIGRALRRRSRMALFFAPLLGLFLNAVFFCGIIGTLNIPDAIKSAFMRSRWLQAGLLAMALLFLLLVARWLFTLHAFAASGFDFAQARRECARFSKGGNIPHLLCLLMAQLVLALLYILSALLLTLLIWGVFRLFSALPQTLLPTISIVTLTVLMIVFGALLPPLGGALIAAFYNHLFPQAPHVAVVASSPAHRHFVRRILAIALLVSALVGSALFAYSYRRGRYNLDIEYIRTTEVTAHRGASAFYPENTMAAFRGAWEQGADWIELDVHQSSDGEIYVMHDRKFTRTMGVNKHSWELSWPEISLLDAGSFFAPEYAGESVPLLADVIEFAKWHGIRLNIELKPTRHDTSLEQRVVDIIHEYGFADECVVTSQAYSALERIKAYDPNIVTAYVMSVAFGDISRMTAADHFSIHASFITRSMVSAIHQAGKQVYAWTVDTKDAIERMIGLGVDNIITNNVILGKQCAHTDQAAEIVQALLEEITDANAF